MSSMTRDICRESPTSGPTLNARTASLCSQSRGEAVNKTQRIGTFIFFARVTQWALVSGSALVLSVLCVSHHAISTLHQSWREHTNHHGGAFVEKHSSRLQTLLALFYHVTQQSGGCRTHVLEGYCRSTHGFKCILVHSGVAQWLHMLPVK